MTLKYVWLECGGDKVILNETERIVKRISKGKNSCIKRIPAECKDKCMKL
jgi:hypothetical protein